MREGSAAFGEGRLGRLLVRVSVLVCIAAVVTWATIRESIRHGRLASSPSYDDVFYMVQGARWLERFRESGAGGVLGEYLRRPPHSPGETALAAAAFAVFGVHEWAPYVLSGVVVLMYLLVADWVLQGARDWQRIAGAALVATVPMSTMVVHEFRPDAGAALLEVLGILLVLRGSLTAAGWRLLWAGAAFGAALLFKPSVFAATGIIAGATLGLASIAEWNGVRPRPSRRGFLRAWALFGLGVAGPALLYPPAGWAYEWRYFRESIFGELAGYWSGTESLSYHMRYYLTGHGGREMLGRHLYLLTGLVVAGGVVTWNRGRRDERSRAAVVSCLLGLTFAMVALNRMKSEFLGLPFQVLLVAAALLGVGAVLRAERESGGRMRWGSVLLVAAVLSGPLLFRWPIRWRSFDDPYVVARRALLDGVYGAVRGAVGEKGGRVVLSSIGAIGPDALELYSIRDRAHLTFYSNQYTGTLEQFRTSVIDAVAVVATDPGVGRGFVTDRYGSAKPFPFVAIQGQVVKAMDTSPEFERVASFPVGPHGEAYRVYRRRAPFSGAWEVLTGLQNVEGPYPDWGLPVVRWALAPATVLRVHCDGDRRMRLGATGRSPVDGLNVRVLIDGQEVAATSMSNGQWQYIEAEADVGAGDHRVEIAYGPAEFGPEGHAVLFRTLIIVAEASP